MDEESRLAWCAGLFDGEGSVSIRRQGQYPSQVNRLQIRLAMTCRKTVERFRDAIGVGRINVQIRKPPRRPAFTWHVSKNGDVVIVVEKLRRHLVTRQGQIRVVGEYLGGADRALCAEKLRALNLRPRHSATAVKAKTPAKAAKKRGARA